MPFNVEMMDSRKSNFWSKRTVAINSNNYPSVISVEKERTGLKKPEFSFSTRHERFLKGFSLGTNISIISTQRISAENLKYNMRKKNPIRSLYYGKDTAGHVCHVVYCKHCRRDLHRIRLIFPVILLFLSTATLRK